MKTIKDLDKEIKAVKAERQQLWKKINPLQAKNKKLYKRIEDLTKAKDQISIKQQSTDWKWLLASEEDDSSVKYEFRQEKLAEFNLSTFGLCKDTGQSILMFGLEKTEDIGKVLTGLNLLLPFIKLRNGAKYIEIMEETCSRFGTYYLAIYSDKIVLALRNYAQREIATFTNLEEALTYVQRNHPRN